MLVFIVNGNMLHAAVSKCDASLETRIAYRFSMVGSAQRLHTAFTRHLALIIR
jgi:hypothetical protein